MLTVTESANLLNVSPSRVRALIKAGNLRAEKIGNSWILQEEDVLSRLASHPSGGRPRKQDAQTPYEHCAETRRDATYFHEFHNLYLQICANFSKRPTAQELTYFESQEERDFALAIADFFLDQRQRKVIAQGLY